jgi:hypothetical protein
MFEPDFWAGNPEALELSLEGTRLVAEELVQFVCQLWYSMMLRVLRSGLVVGRAPTGWR